MDIKLTEHWLPTTTGATHHFYTAHVTAIGVYAKDRLILNNLDAYQAFVCDVFPNFAHRIWLGNNTSEDRSDILEVYFKTTVKEDGFNSSLYMDDLPPLYEFLKVMIRLYGLQCSLEHAVQKD